MGRNFSVMEEVTFYSPAKINLGLEITGVRDDGYHEIITLFQTVDLWDKLIIRPRSDDAVIISGNNPEVPWDKNNLIFRAAELLRKETGFHRGAEIFVEKNIPPGRGLGGGSSNAAVTLMALNRLWKTALDDYQLFSLAAQLGADVPFFLTGGLCLGLGRGEKIKTWPEFNKWWVLLILPDFSVSTAMAYREYDRLGESLTSNDKESKIIQFLEAKDSSLIRSLRNDLEAVVFRIHPQLAEIKQEIKRSGAELSLMSGSGSALFGLFLEEEPARFAAFRMKGRYRTQVVATVSRDEYRRKLGTGASPNW